MSKSSLIEVADGQEAANVVASRLIEAVAAGAGVIGLATGATFDAIYGEVVRRQPDWKHVTFVQLDEYAALPPEDHRSFRNTLLRSVLEPLGLSPTQLRDPDYDGPVDIQLLGIGRNGHIAFNEPGSSWESDTRVVTLTKETREANAFAFNDNPRAVPTQAITRGIATILAAKTILLVATGQAKAYALAHALEIAPSEEFPASSLQGHPDVTVVADHPAMSLLERT